MLSVAIAVAILFLGSGCEKNETLDANNSCNNLPHSAAPSGIAGRWASGFTSMTQIIDVYTGRWLGNT